MRMNTALRSFPRDARGAIAIEFAIIAPVLLMMLVVVADFGLGFYRRMETQTAAQRGAMYATTKAGFSQTAVANVITSSRGSITANPAPRQFCGCPTTAGVTESTCGSACAAGGTTGSYVQASAQSTYTPILRYPGLPSSLTFSASQVVRVQ